MYLLIEVAGYINTLPTVALVMLTAVIGVYLLKRQGLATLTRGLSRLNGGEIPAQEMAEGLLLAVAGALLVTPGFITDTVGFLLLLPLSRQAIARVMLSRVQIHSAGSQQAGFGRAGFTHNMGPNPRSDDTSPFVDPAVVDPANRDRAKPDSTTIEGEFSRRC